ncbi:MAG TPA: glycosyl hydrolase-related protein [Planctomycetota bacterium]|nr:glycosyl hydrolase-related protein [Planctomycetota bacterium]
MWTIYVTNDNCPDYTWGFTEEQTRKAFADIVKGHLDEMTRTDNQPPESQNRYNAAVTQEALCFVEHYPQRKDELIRRIKEGRLYVSPYLCNSLWAFQGVEGAIRTFYPARRLERDWGIRCLDVAEHIEEPSLPWGVAPILAGCGIRWLSNPYYGYDSTFRGLKNPPLFLWEGPDGSQVRVVMDRFASNSASYTQGAKLLREPNAIPGWVAHYAKLGDAFSVYGTRAILASGTHGDINPGSGGQARGFAEKIIAYNKQGGQRPKLINATLPQFCQAVDADQAKTPFLPTVRGCFGHSWDVWPVCLAKYVADMREGERQFLAAEALIAMASLRDPRLAEATRADRERAEWCLAMLSDHAWNGTGDANKRHNADLRRAWAQEFNALALKLRHQAWQAAGLDEAKPSLTLFNPLTVPRAGLIRLDRQAGDGTGPDVKAHPCQFGEEDGRSVMYFISPTVPGLGIASLEMRNVPSVIRSPRLRATEGELESPFYRLAVDPKTGGIASVVHKPTGKELVAKEARALCQSVYHDGQEHLLSDVKVESLGRGAVLARLRISGKAAGIEIANLVTLYDQLDRVDFDIRVKKPTTTKQERLCQFFPLLGDGAVVRIETTGAVIRPKPQPEGDLLPGADTRRFAVQGFLDASLPGGPGVTIAPLDAFVLRTDLGPLAFECLGNDQNYREVVQDQHGVTEFRFRYSLRAHKGPYDQAEAMAWSRSVATPLLVATGHVGGASLPREIGIDPARAIATCLKPADDPRAGGLILRLWETAGRAEPLVISARGFSKAIHTDLLERDQEELKFADGKLSVPIRPHGFAAVRLMP